MADDAGPSWRAIEVLRLLKRHHNVLISGPPGIGKSRLLNEVDRWFRASVSPAHTPASTIPLPQGLSVTPEEASDWLPAPVRHTRDVFTTAFHPGAKYRDFLRGLVPAIGGGQAFVVSSGTLYRAAQLARTPDGAALVIVDEINRGPAVQIFGDAIVALERDKRLSTVGSELATTQYFEILADDGSLERFALPHQLYILAAMNQADTSVEPLDVAFLRRFEPYRLAPDEVVLRQYFDLPDGDLALPATPGSATDVYAAALLAWRQVNARISLGRGSEYQLGHGVFMEADGPPTSVEEALDFIEAPWRRVRAHIDEVFFGHVRGVAAVLNVGAPGHPVTLHETYFAGDPVAALQEPEAKLYELLLAVAANNAQ